MTDSVPLYNKDVIRALQDNCRAAQERQRTLIVPLSKYTEDEIAEIMYYREQVPVLAAFALRDCHVDHIRQEIVSESNLHNEPLFDSFGELNYKRSDLIHLLNWFSSLVDKSKSGGWIASASLVFRVECINEQGAQSEYLTTDEITVRFQDRKNGDALTRRNLARELAAKLNVL